MVGLHESGPTISVFSLSSNANHLQEPDEHALERFDNLDAIRYTLGTDMTDFATLTAVHSIAEGTIATFAIDVPDGWQQGRGTYGGFGLACLARAIETVESSSERPLRTLNAELCGPLMPGAAEIHVEVLRRGAGMTTVAARTIQKWNGRGSCECSFRTNA